MEILLKILSFIGAIGLFIFGMKMMSDTLQKIAGNKMRRIISTLTSNRFKSLLTGTFITALIQTSSATTVMIVSFVNAGLLSLSQSIPLILGANIGTTIKVWLFSLLGFKFQMGLFALPLIGISVPFLFSNKSKWKTWAEFVIGFSLLFLGLDFLKSLMPEVESVHDKLFFLSAYTEQGFLSVLIFVLAGMFITMLIQSSSVTITLTLVMCYNGWLPFEMALAMVLGENVGTTVTANLAAIIANKNGKRAALIHSMVNIIGVLIVLIFFKYSVVAITFFLYMGGIENPLGSPYALTAGIAIYHSMFNILNAALMLPFSHYIEKLSFVIIKDKVRRIEKQRLNKMSGAFLFSEMSILEAGKHMEQHFKSTKKIFDYIPRLIIKKNIENINIQIGQARNEIEMLYLNAKEINSMLTKLSQKELSEQASKKVRTMILVLNEGNVLIQNISQMLYIIEGKNSQNAWFTQELRNNLNIAFNLIDGIYKKLFDYLHVFLQGNEKQQNVAEVEIDELSKICIKLAKEHIENINKAEYSYISGIFYSSLINNCRNLSDSFSNINMALKDI